MNNFPLWMTKMPTVAKILRKSNLSLRMVQTTPMETIWIWSPNRPGKTYLFS